MAIIFTIMIGTNLKRVMSQAIKSVSVLRRIVMALSNKAKEVLIVACANKSVGEELAAAIEAGANGQAAAVAAIGATSDLVGVDGTGSNAAPLVGTESRLDAIEAKVDAVIAALKAAGLMAS
jgi:hypothetical protein